MPISEGRERFIFPSYSQNEREPYDSFHYIIRDGGYYTKKHCHDDITHLIYVTRGTLLLTLEDGTTMTLGVGDAVSVPRGVHHTLKTEDGYEQFAVNLYPDAADPDRFRGLAALFSEVSVLSVPSLLPLTEGIAARLKLPSEASRQAVFTGIDLFLQILCETAEKEASHKFGDRLSLLLDGYLSAPPRLEEIASALRISVPHMERLCKTYCGCGVIRLYNRKRYAKACELLVSSSLSVKEIAVRIGFDAPSNFSLFFKRYAGMPPIQYREVYGAHRDDQTFRT